MGLMEIVSEPDMRSPLEAAGYVRALQRLLRRLGASDGDMEKGSMRVDANISIHKRGSKQWGMRCEIKNLNSVRFMMQALGKHARQPMAAFAWLTRHRQNRNDIDTSPSTPRILTQYCLKRLEDSTKPLERRTR